MREIGKESLTNGVLGLSDFFIGHKVAVQLVKWWTISIE